MSSRTQSALLGAFVVGAIVIAIAGGLFFAGGGFGTERSRVVMVFDGSLYGLSVGAPVALRGVTIGQVTDIDVQLNPTQGDLTMIVEAEIEATNVQMLGRVDEDIADNLVAQGLRAQLNTQSLLTGLLFIQLDFYPDSTARLTNIDRGIPEIPTIPTELEQLRESLQEIDLVSLSENVNKIASGVDSLVNNEDMQSLPGALRETLQTVQVAAATLDTALASNAGRVAGLIDEGDQMLKTINESLPSVMSSMESSFARLESAVVSAEQSLKRVEEAAAPDSAPRQQLQGALQELSLAARALRSLAYALEENPQSLLRGRTGDASK